MTGSSRAALTTSQKVEFVSKRTGVDLDSGYLFSLALRQSRGLGN